MEIKDTLERKLRAELDFFKIYAIFVIGLVTGNINLINDYAINQNRLSLILLIIGLITMIIILITLIQTYKKIKDLIK